MGVITFIHGMEFQCQADRMRPCLSKNDALSATRTYVKIQRIELLFRRYSSIILTIFVCPSSSANIKAVQASLFFAS